MSAKNCLSIPSIRAELGISNCVGHTQQGTLAQSHIQRLARLDMAIGRIATHSEVSFVQAINVLVMYSYLSDKSLVLCR
jgi:hypothetical protein